MKKALLVVMIGTLPGCWCGHDVTPREVTLTKITVAINQIQAYCETNHQLPRSLDEAWAPAGHLGSPTDGWGNLLLYSVSEEGILRVTSLGKDAVVGGEGENQDITSVHRTHREDGSLWAGQDMWTVQSQVHVGER